MIASLRGRIHSCCRMHRGRRGERRGAATFPVAGVDGTLYGRFRNSPLKGKLWAKTGTLNETNALSGYLQTASGKTLAFSILVNGHGREAGGAPGDGEDLRGYCGDGVISSLGREMQLQVPPLVALGRNDRR